MRLGPVPSTSWAIVMTCGIVSTDLSAVHQPVLSAILLWFAAGVWVFLAGALGVPLFLQQGRFGREVASPGVLTIVAATAVLGSRLAVSGYRTVPAVLLVLTAVLCAVLLGPVLRRWVTPTMGIAFLIGVSADSVALLSATLAVPYGASWLCWAAMGCLLGGLGLYCFAAARFDLRQLLSGHGDHWIAGGALAISALAAGRITEAAGQLGLVRQHHHALTVGTLVVWCAAMLWLPVLIAAEVVRPRIRYDIRRWATGFPIGMYAACSFTVGQVTGIGGIVEFARLWTWVSVAATLALLAGLVRRLALTDVWVPAH